MTSKESSSAKTSNENTVCSIDEISGVENYIEEILNNTNFDNLNFLTAQKSKNQNIKIKSGINENSEFISINSNSMFPYARLISEKEFLKIVGAGKKGIHKKSGYYQESLYSNYMEAKKECDEGYISDVLSKAILLRNNINYAKLLMKNRKFMKEWRNNFGNETPLSDVKNSGSIRRITIIKSRIQ